MRMQSWRRARPYITATFRENSVEFSTRYIYNRDVNTNQMADEQNFTKLPILGIEIIGRVEIRSNGTGRED